MTATGGNLREHAEHLNGLAARVPRTEGADPATASSRRRLLAVRVVSSVILLVGLAAASVAWSDLALDPFPQHVSLLPLLLGAGVVGAMLATSAYWLAVRALRGTSHAARLVSELIVTIWIPIVGATVVAAHQYNLKAIGGEDHVEVTRVAGLPESRTGRYRSYHVELPALDNGRIPAGRYSSTRQINDSLREHQPARVRWREGKLASFLLLGPPEPVSAGGPEAK